MSTTDTRTPEQITDGSWTVRFIGTPKSNSVIARRGWAEVNVPSPFPGTKVYEANIVIRPGRTTLASAKRILEIAHPVTDVMPVKAWKFNDQHEQTDTFIYPQFR
ncbi:hypothetical protein [Corynebacterium variabile]|uniref:hypothetical protein n=1 Tax=Corynebacterium variabile TaxID=1727 RepID=UPI003BB067BB